MIEETLSTLRAHLAQDAQNDGLTRVGVDDAGSSLHNVCISCLLRWDNRPDDEATQKAHRAHVELALRLEGPGVKRRTRAWRRLEETCGKHAASAHGRGLMAERGTWADRLSAELEEHVASHYARHLDRALRLRTAAEPYLDHMDRWVRSLATELAQRADAIEDEVHRLHRERRALILALRGLTQPPTTSPAGRDRVVARLLGLE